MQAESTFYPRILLTESHWPPMGVALAYTIQCESAYTPVQFPVLYQAGLQAFTWLLRAYRENNQCEFGEQSPANALI